MVTKKSIRIIDSVLIIVSILFIASFVTYARPLVIAPLDNFATTNTSVLFEFERGDTILIDDNPEFSSPQEIQTRNNQLVNLKPGEYYWKVNGVLDSKVRRLEVVSEVNLRMERSGEGYKLLNEGNVEVGVDIYDDKDLIENTKLNVSEEKQLTGTIFIGRQI